MESSPHVLLESRQDAGRVLINQLMKYKDTTAVVVGMPFGGLCVASPIAEALHLPLEIMPIRKIQHPSNNRRTIGSVTSTEIFLEDCSRNIPQDYISHQIAALRGEISADISYYYDGVLPTTLTGKTVIIVDDILENCDAVLSGIMAIRKQQPAEIIFVAAVVEQGAMEMLTAEVGRIIFLQAVQKIDLWDSFFVEPHVIHREDAQAILLGARGKYPQSQGA